MSEFNLAESEYTKLKEDVEHVKLRLHVLTQIKELFDLSLEKPMIINGNMGKQMKAEYLWDLNLKTKSKIAGIIADHKFGLFSYWATAYVGSTLRVEIWKDGKDKDSKNPDILYEGFQQFFKDVNKIISEYITTSETKYNALNLFIGIFSNMSILSTKETRLFMEEL